MTAPIVPPLNDSAIPRARMLRGQRFDRRPQSARKCRAFAKPENRARHREADEGRHPGVRHAGGGPDSNREQHTDAQSDEVEDRSPDRVAQRIGEEEERGRVREVLRRESGVGEDRGRQDRRVPGDRRTTATSRAPSRYTEPTSASWWRWRLCRRGLRTVACVIVSPSMRREPRRCGWGA